MNIPLAVGFCECGCGEKPSTWKQSCAAKGVKKGDFRRFVKGHYQIQKKPVKYATCHTHRPAKSKGFCGACYHKSRVEANPELKRHTAACNKESWLARYASVDKVAHAKARRDKVLKYRYGITEDQYQAILVDQGGICAACDKPGGDTRQTRLHVDHNHATGQRRGLLCARCNIALGVMEVGFARLVTLSKYLSRHEPENRGWGLLATLELREEAR